jgi:DNA-binding CsgD family transcriptional regulator
VPEPRLLRTAAPSDRSRTAGDAERASARLAELVAALSLGIDLGFGQPMEHVLRQCLIALRIAERLGLDDDARADVYYTALLVNVGCHTDAHEQAKWFGDDIALKADKYGPHDLRSKRMMVSGMRRIGAGNPPLHRFRISLTFVLSGHREVDVLRLLAVGMSNKEIAQRLVITPKTVGNHVEHIYTKIDIRTRAGAGLFAMRHGLLPEETFPAVAPVA